MAPSEPLGPSSTALPASARELTRGDLAYVNRLVSLEHVLPNVTHELNNALQVISGLSEILATRPGLSDDVVQKLQRMHAQATRCYGLLRDLLSYARRDDVAPVADVARAIERALDLRRFHLARARVTVQIEPGPSGLTAAMDSQHLVQVLVNLVLNAEQAMSGRPDPTLTISYGEEAGNVVIAVIDTGPGVDTATVEQTCFAPFWTTRTGALGLGLPAARALVEAARGTLAFTAPTRVDVRVPRR